MSAPNQNYIYLHKVDGDANNNKFYEMKANEGKGTFTAKYGREGTEKPALKEYPMHKWDSIYAEKTGKTKGYTDVTHLKSVVKDDKKTTKDSSGQIISTDAEVANLVTMLQSFANVATAASYKVEAKSVTQAQVDAAQVQIDNLSNSLKKFYGKTNWSLDAFNKALMQLMVIIPRKMTKVADHLMKPGVTRKEIETLIDNEQALLDSMAGQVLQNAATDEADEADDSSSVESTTLLDTLGLQMRPATKAEFADAKSHAKDHGHKIKRVFVVVNNATQKAFDEDMKKATGDGKKTMTLWHGSRAQNWWFIVQQGLRIRPSGAIHTGSMFGDGIYFASEDDKSWGYTDSGRWVGGGKKAKTYMALYTVRVGKQFATTSSDWSLSHSKIQAKGGFDSTWGQKGPSLYRHEYIIYRSQQSTIKYLVEFE